MYIPIRKCRCGLQEHIFSALSHTVATRHTTRLIQCTLYRFSGAPCCSNIPDSTENMLLYVILYVRGMGDRGRIMVNILLKMYSHCLQQHEPGRVNNRVKIMFKLLPWILKNNHGGEGRNTTPFQIASINTFRSKTFE